MSEDLDRRIAVEVVTTLPAKASSLQSERFLMSDQDEAEMMNVAYTMGYHDGVQDRRLNPNIESEYRLIYTAGYRRGGEMRTSREHTSPNRQGGSV